MDDSSDPTIRIDAQRRCNYCTRVLSEIGEIYFPGTSEIGNGSARLDALIAKAKREGQGKKYDCIMGVSGGLDSSYLAYLGYKWFSAY